MVLIQNLNRSTTVVPQAKLDPKREFAGGCAIKVTIFLQRHPCICKCSTEMTIRALSENPVIRFFTSPSPSPSASSSPEKPASTSLISPIAPCPSLLYFSPARSHHCCPRPHHLHPYRHLHLSPPAHPAPATPPPADESLKPYPSKSPIRVDPPPRQPGNGIATWRLSMGSKFCVL